MNKLFYFLKPYFSETIWASNELKNYFQTNKNVGEAWLISALRGKQSFVLELPLDQFYQENPDFFNFYPAKEYPNLHKIISAKADLSIQVHPNDDFARQFNSKGKDECWFVLSAKNPFVIGAKALTIESFFHNLQEQDLEKWKQILVYKNLQKGDFCYIPAGLIHAIPQETTVYELQQASDITYRVFDYNRRDQNGDLRELHLDKARQTINLNTKAIIVKNQEKLVQNKYFNLSKIELKNTFTLQFDKETFWFEAVIVEGAGEINNEKFQKYDAIIIKNQKEIPIVFKGEAIILLNKIR
ncbi:type I phosphomannose isomerase catalytic subunit [Mycoplasma sp. 'Moose RK']|uniref:type I phosphomannose isomerase catalytic subunit n=1 Tax=Mycoplasma sp. 'Moose RK' TaxID=2780095 RepID=UPI0018C30231|nr:type I phosphomannose isomerase catalytic subunit [Mycoplasma sp. 'Moose RK']MBG0730851.1 class I mannose-6-phosphate isomerase [Mycoplasma sp. 'Moose RK']